MKRAFVDSDGVLKSHGFMVADGDYRAVEVSVDFELQPGEWRIVGDEWVRVEGTATEDGARLLRTLYLQATDWCVLRHVEQLAMKIEPTLAADQYQQLLVYRQQLRDLPASSGFPKGTTVPPVPDFVRLG